MVQTAGGGGYGDPIKRPIERVQADVVDGVVSVDAAAKEYGVVLHPQNHDIDRVATEHLRASMRA